MNIPYELGIKKGTYIGPKDGWKPKTYYLVEASFSSHNPLHTYIFYSGFLSSDGQPSGYNCILSPVVEGKPRMQDTYYLKVLNQIALEA